MKTIREYINLVESAQTAVTEQSTTPIDYKKFSLARSTAPEEKDTVFNLAYNNKFVGDIGYLIDGWYVGEAEGRIYGPLSGKYKDTNRYATKDQALMALIKAVEPHLYLVVNHPEQFRDLKEDAQLQLPMSGGELKIVFVDPDNGAKVVGKANDPGQAKKIIQDKFYEIHDTGDRLRKVAANIFVLEPDYENTGERATADNYEHFYHWIVQ